VPAIFLSTSLSASPQFSVALSKLGYTNLTFAEPGSKINMLYYQDTLMLPVICNIAGDEFVFPQDNTPKHHIHDTVQVLYSETAQFISPDIQQS